jgi:hypothetical protein
VATTPPAYDERLAVPVRWWVLSALFLASVLVAFLVSTPSWVAATATAVLTAVVAGVLLGYGAARVSVRDGVLTAGRARIGVGDLGPVQVLDAGAARLLAGRHADARAYLLIRPYLSRAVQVEVTDARDPTPYWLVATRRPERLADALAAAGAGSGRTTGSIPPTQTG